jgi:hypothetical protein
MTFDKFRNECLEMMHPLHTAQIATMYRCTIDELINDAYTGEIDDINDLTPESFVRWVDSTYTRLH